MGLINPVKNKVKNNKILKRSLTGMEAEFILIDNNGKVSNEASKIVNVIRKKHENIPIRQECGNNLIEFGSYPSESTHNPTLDLINSIETTYQVCDKMGYKLHPFGTYPGKFDPVMSNKKGYKIKELIFGVEKFKIAARCVGFHHHYTLPKGVFDPQKKMIKEFKKSKIARTMISSYNFEIASDPIMTLFMQSSPFYQGIQMAKDSRILVYRGGRKLDYMESLYSNHQQFGGLPPYKQTRTDLYNSLSLRWLRWQKEIKRVAPKEDISKIYHSILDIAWGPVKINKVGTLEQRDMDINYLSICVGVAVILKFCLSKIQREYIEVIPSDFAIHEPFKMENGILYIPPHTHVRNQLQKYGVYEGYANDKMHYYTERFLRFAKPLIPNEYSGLIKPILNMVENRKSISDYIIAHAKKKSYLVDGKISDEDAANMSLHYSEKFMKDLLNIRKKLEGMAV